VSQHRTLQLLQQIGHPVKPSELEKYGERVGALDPTLENHGSLSRDLHNLVKWGLAKKDADGRYELVAP
jgi:DNA-binding IclR family transcriptional regulator